ncbi:tRNA (guanosine(46)-N7)-methyltransferase TrmB [Comamonas serinivorans]|uniref:tRNA (guanine-N(7)-)-methyltransferase n=1 Tax=Comamonas serinivorans TaxID=1082851 RepID=A0A1Y0EQE2_9BURK|nr:tRNA (guanosine(46)-N7)-methyltransferase TrmB [Comamonas serinivorans]ARU05875.1 tRNA (guanosine(46)-N7)-methyltransferase TrmB [Comamonas serinivorans]
MNAPTAPEAPPTPPGTDPEVSAPEPSAPAQAPHDVAHPRSIRSFVTRAGRVTTGQAKALADFGPRFVCPYAPNPDFVPQLLAEARAQGQTFTRVVMEIGFGMGTATAHIAALQSDTLFLCCEVHEPGVGALLKLVGEQGLQNIRIVQHDAVEVLAHMVGPAALDGFHIFFPDPWHKKRHHKRRLIQPAFVDTLVDHLQPGGYIHCATDWQPYAEQMLAVLGANTRLSNRASAPDGYAETPSYRPETKFERRGLRLGHGVWDLVFERT